MKILTLPVGPLETNCHLVFLEAPRRLFVIDPGADAETILRGIRSLPDFGSAQILLTHAHIDHIGAAGAVAAALGVDRVTLDPGDLPLYRSPDNAIPPLMPAARNLPETEAPGSGNDFTAIPLPGHSPGGTGYLFAEAGTSALFAGDSLFAGSIGRTDLWGGDYEELLDSIRERLLTLPPETPVYPGHGGSTTIGRERDTNPYLR